MRNAFTDPHGYANCNPAAYSDTEGYSAAEAAAITATAPDPIAPKHSVIGDR